MKKHPVRALLVNAALVALAFGLLGLVIWKNRGQIHEIFSRKLDLRLIALAFAVYFTSLSLTFLRWYWLVRVIEPTFKLRHAALLGYIGNVFNLVIPGAVGGDLIKAAYLIRMRINKTQAIASMVLDRILGLLGLFLLAGVAGVVAWPMATVEVRRLVMIAWALFAAGALGLTAVFTQALTRRFPGLLSGHGRIAMILNELRAMSTTYRSRIRGILGALLYSAGCHSLFVTAFYMVSRALFPTHLPSLGPHFLMVPLILFTTAVPLPFGALGLTEEVSDQLFKLIDHPGGALAMIGFRVLMYAGAVVSACVYLANFAQVRGLTETAEHLEAELIEGGLEPSGSDLQEEALPVHPRADQP